MSAGKEAGKEEVKTARIYANQVVGPPTIIGVVVMLSNGSIISKLWT